MHSAAPRQLTGFSGGQSASANNLNRPGKGSQITGLVLTKRLAIKKGMNSNFSLLRLAWFAVLAAFLCAGAGCASLRDAGYSNCPTHVIVLCSP